MRFSNALVIPEVATPANPGASTHDVYFKTDGGLYVKSSAGTEKLVVNSTAKNNGTLQWYSSSTTASIPSATWTPVTGMTPFITGTADYYTTAFGTPGTGQTTMTVAGTYLLTCSFTWGSSNTTGRRTLRIAVNGVEARRTDCGASPSNMTQVVSHIQYLAVGDIVEADVFQNTGAGLAPNASPGHDWQFVRLGE